MSSCYRVDIIASVGSVRTQRGLLMTKGPIKVELKVSIEYRHQRATRNGSPFFEWLENMSDSCLII